MWKTGKKLNMQWQPNKKSHFELYQSFKALYGKAFKQTL